MAVGESANRFGDVVRRLRAAGCVFAEDEARVLREAAGADARELERLVAARVGGVPLEPLVGWAEFCGMRVVVRPGVFVPRRRTELLAELAVDEALRCSALGTGEVPREARAERVTVVDLCCGTAAVGAVVSARVPAAEVHAADLDPVAVRNARENIRPPENVHEGDLFGALPERLRGRIGVLAVNAPYVPTSAIATMPPEARDHEAPMALDGGADGLDVQRRVTAGAPEWLGPAGVLLIETSEAQSPATARLMAAAGLTVDVEHDDDRDATVVRGRMPAQSL